MAWSASDKVTLVAEPGLFSVAGTERTMRAIQLFRQRIRPEPLPGRDRGQPGAQRLRRTHVPAVGDAVHVR